MCPQWILVDNSTKLEDCKSLVLLAMGPVTAQKLAQWQENYLIGHPYQLWSWMQNEQLLGIFGLKQDGETNYITHIAVSVKHRHQGIGSQMVRDMVKNFPARLWMAQTDDEALGFYQSLGFATRILGHQPRGFRVRYWCVLANS